MRRRDFIKSIACAASAWSCRAHAQQSMPVIGLLNGRARGNLPKLLAAFRQGLNDTGYIEGQNVAIEYRFAENQYERPPALAADLVRHQVTVIAATGAPAALAAKAATTTVPVVFETGGDPIKLDLVTNLNRPGGNVTGVTQLVQEAVEALKKEALEPQLVSGGGTGSYYFESCSGVYNELQCGSYAFMDADYGRILDKDGKRIDKGEWKNALFILTSVMSHTKADKAICDAGLKAQSVDSGLPFVYGRDDVQYVKCSDEHGVIEDPKGVLKINQRLRLVPGHCDPTCNVHDWYVGIRNGKVETLWPVSARGKAY